MVSCAIRACTSRSAVTKKISSGITFHRFPIESSNIYRQQWISFVGRGPWTPTKFSVLCSKHFEEKCFDRTSRCLVRLKYDAVPTIREWNTENSQMTNPTEDASNTTQVRHDAINIKEYELSIASTSSPPHINMPSSMEIESVLEVEEIMIKSEEDFTTPSSTEIDNSLTEMASKSEEDSDVDSLSSSSTTRYYNTPAQNALKSQILSLEEQLFAATESRDTYGFAGVEIEKEIRRIRTDIETCKKLLWSKEVKAQRQKKFRDERQRILKDLKKENPNITNLQNTNLILLAPNVTQNLHDVDNIKEPKLAIPSTSSPTYVVNSSSMEVDSFFLENSQTIKIESNSEEDCDIDSTITNSSKARHYSSPVQEALKTKIALLEKQLMALIDSGNGGLEIQKDISRISTDLLKSKKLLSSKEVKVEQQKRYRHATKQTLKVLKKENPHITSLRVGVKGKTIKSQGREIINNVITFMRREAENGLEISLLNYRKRVLMATGVGKNTYQSIMEEGRRISDDMASTSFKSPDKKRQCNFPVLDNLIARQIEEIRSIIYNFYIKENRPTVSSILQEMKDREVGFEGQTTSLRKLLKSIGFRWKNTSDNRKVLVEKHDIRLKRIEFLKKITQYRADGRNIVYADVTYIHSSDTSSGWSDNKYEMELKKPLSKGRKLVIIHAGGEKGFINNALMIFKSGLKSGDHHDDMNQNNFIKWVETQLIPNLPEKSVLVLENASYHNVSSEKIITSASLKIDLVNWMKDRNIDFEENLTKPEMYAKVLHYKNRFPLKPKLDLIMEEHGHDVLRLPPYHPELNPIEKILILVKNWVATRNITFNLADVERLARERFEQVGVNDWKTICEHVKKYENEQIQKEHLLDDTMENFPYIINTVSSTEGSSCEDTDLD